MTPEAVIRLDNDGLNMAADENRLYVRCMRGMHSYDMATLSQAAHAVLFKKDGKARGFSLCGAFVYLTDFCDLYLLTKCDFQVVGVYHIGKDLSSDLGAVRFAASTAYIGVRNGRMAVFCAQTQAIKRYDVADAGFWDFCVVDNHIYAGTVQGELLKIDTEKMQVLQRVSLGKKNLYSVVRYGDFLYTVSQDMSIKAICMETLAVAHQAKNAVKGMARILGFHGDSLIVADANKVSFWHAGSLRHQDTAAFPTGSYNKGIVLVGDTLFGSDSRHIYRMTLA